jgi:hypothetical protein
MWPLFAGPSREKNCSGLRHKSAGGPPRWNQPDRGLWVPMPRKRHDPAANPLRRGAFSAVPAGTGFRRAALPLRQFDKDSATGMPMTRTRTRQDFDHDDVRATDILMALGGFWVLLGVIAWLAMI